MFALGYVFAHQIQTSLDRAQWIIAAVALVLVLWLLHRYYKALQRAGLPVGPRVLESNDEPLPPDDLQTTLEDRKNEQDHSPILKGGPACF